MEEYYKTDDSLMEDLNKLKNYGTIGNLGEFVFSKCEKCDGPKLGHIVPAAGCKKEIKFSETEINEIKEKLMESVAFDNATAMLDD
jgi:hypothetical protein